MKKNIMVLGLFLILIIGILSFVGLNQCHSEIINHELATDIAWLLIKDKFEPIDFLESYLQVERRGYNWYVGLDYQRMYYENVLYDDYPDYEVIIRGRDGKIKLVKSAWGKTIKYKHNLVDKELAIQITELLLRTKLNPNETYNIFFNIEKIKGNWHVRLDEENKDPKIGFAFEIVMSAQNGKIKRIEMK